jgi:hypothetical protein
VRARVCRLFVAVAVAVVVVVVVGAVEGSALPRL